MITLCLDTSHKYLSIILIKDNKILDSYSELCFKKQSEYIFVKLNQLFDNNKLVPKDISAICISKGPGSYTGVRIAMTIAKTICSLTDIKLYTISTLRLYANNLSNTLVLMDARSKRAYYAVYDVSKCIIEDRVDYIDNIEFNDYNVVGDKSLIGEVDNYYNIGECFLNTIDYWLLEDDVDYVTPMYLKDNSDYLND